MSRIVLFVLCASAAAHAGEGVYITIDGGYGTWAKDDFRSRLDKQGMGKDPVSGLGNTSLLVDRQMPDGGIFGLHLGYNIAGHVAFEGSLTLRPYDILADTRGGAAIAGLAARWYPLQGLVRSSRQFDVSFVTGVHYVLSGGNGIHDPATNTKLDNTGRGFDGTAALHVALLVAGVEPDNEVVVSTLSFIAPANAIRYVNAWPVFVDAEPIGVSV